VRPCGARCRPSRRSDRLHLREAAEAALGGRSSGDLPSGQAPTARRDQAARWRSARLPPCRCPRRPRRQLRLRTRPGTGVLLRRGETEGGSSLVGRRSPRIGPAGEPPGTAPGRGGGTWRLPAMACVRTTASTLRTQLPASVAFGSVLPAHGPRCEPLYGEPPRGEPLHGEPLHGEPLHGEPPRGVLRNTPEVERGRAAPALRASAPRASDLPHRLSAAESAP
jgi:hypothetical protein